MLLALKIDPLKSRRCTFLIIAEILTDRCVQSWQNTPPSSRFALLCTKQPAAAFFHFHDYQWELACGGITVWMQLSGNGVPAEPTGQS